MMDIEAPEILSHPPDIPARVLLGPGPSNLPPDVKEAMVAPLLGHCHQEFLEIMRQVKAGLQYIFQTRNSLTFAFSGTGHTGMEGALMNLVEPGERVLVCEHGIWGQRAADMAQRQGAEVQKLALKTYSPAVLFICHGESSTGVVQPLEGLGALCHKYNCLLLVDTVASLCAVPFKMDQWEIDCAYTGSQKALSCPPGLAPISFGEKAWKKIENRKTRPYSFYLDAKLVGNYWSCFQEAPKYREGL